jgi:hypothetical protein
MSAAVRRQSLVLECSLLEFGVKLRHSGAGRVERDLVVHSQYTVIPEDGNCNVYRNVGQLSDFDAANTEKAKIHRLERMFQDQNCCSI